MKKITLSLLTVVCAVGTAFSQLNYSHFAPPANTTTQVRLPNGTQSHASLNGIYYIHAYEMLPMNLSTINEVSLVLQSGTGSTPVTGNFTVYLANSYDMVYAKGSVFSTAFATMAKSFVGQMTIPAVASATTIPLTLTTPFNFLGGGLYVGYQWECAGPYSAGPATYSCASFFNTTYNTPAEVWCGVSTSSILASASNTVNSGSQFRPSLIFGAVNTATTEVEVVMMNAPGAVLKSFNTPQNISAWVVNSSIGALTNVSVALNVTGANPHTDLVVIPNMAAGQSQTVNFVNYNPQTIGVSNMSVAALIADQTLTNNIKVWSQSVTCQAIAVHPANAVYNNGYGYQVEGLWMTKVNIPSTGSVTGVRLPVYNHTSNNGKSLYAVLLNAAGNVVSAGPSIPISAGQSFVFPFVSPQQLSANTDYYIGIAQPSASAIYYPMAYMSYTPFVTPIYYTTSNLNGGAVPNKSEYYGYFGIEPLLTTTAAISLSATAVPTLICKGETATLTVQGPPGVNYLWSGPNSYTSTADTIVVTPPISPTQSQVVVSYNVSGSDNSACPITGAAVSITVKSTAHLSVNSKSVCVGSKVVITPTSNPTGATFSITGGTFSNTAGTSFTVTTSAVGTTTYAISGSLNGCTTATNAVSSVTANGCVGLSEFTASGAIRIYPNPAVNGRANIAGLDGENTISVFNTLGQAVIVTKTNENDIEIDLSGEAAGHYVVKIEGGSGVQTIKLVNQK